MPSLDKIPEQVFIPWRVAFKVSMAGLRRRFLRSMITMCGVILAIAFLSYMLVSSSITQALISANNNELNLHLQQSGVDIFTGGKIDSMTVLLLGLTLLTCMVGIINAMLMSVTERIREIGTLKCLGASDFFIVQTHFIESSLQGICGAVIGIVMGCLVAVAVAFSNFKGFVTDTLPVLPILKDLSVSFAIGALISIVASIAPAYMAAKKEPVEALRVEE